MLFTARVKVGRPTVGMIVEQNILCIPVPSCVLEYSFSRILYRQPNALVMRFSYTVPKFGLQNEFASCEETRKCMEHATDGSKNRLALKFSIADTKK